MADIDRVALDTLSDEFTRQQIFKYAQESFPSRLESLLQDVQSSSVRSKLRSNTGSFDAFMQISQLLWSILAPSTGIALLSGFLYLAIHQSARQAEQTQGNSGECYHRIIDKLRSCNDLATVFYSRCKDPRMPRKHVEERLGQAYSLLLSFIGAIVDSLEQSPLSK